MKHRLFAVSCSILLILLGSTVIFGWLAHIPKMIQVIPGLVGMVFNTALCFVLTGILVIISNHDFKNQRAIQFSLSAIIFCISLLTLSQDLFHYNLGTDQFIIKPWLEDPNPTPGRMAPNTAIGLLLISLIGFCMPYGRYKKVAIIIQVSTVLILFISLLGLLVYSLKLEFLFRWYSYTRMAVHTAIGFLIASFSWWATWLGSKWYKDFYQGQEDKKIILITGIIFLSISMIAGLGGIAWLTYMNIGAAEQALQDSLQEKINIITEDINNTKQELTKIAFNPLLINEIKKTPIDLRRLNEKVQSIKPNHLSVIQLQDKKGKVIYSSGSLIVNPALSVSLNSSGKIDLIWKDGFWLKVQFFLSEGAKQPKGVKFIGEIPLTAVNRVFKVNEGGDYSRELTMCVSSAPQSALCFPNRFIKRIFKVELIKNLKPLPMSYAFSRAKGVVHTSDYRNRNVIAAYNYIPNLPLGLTMKFETAEIYKPIAQQLKYILPVVILFICCSLIFLYMQILPLVRKVVVSEKIAQEAKEKLELSFSLLKKRTHEISLLRELSAHLLSCPTLDEAYKRIVRCATRLLPSTSGALYLSYSSTSEELVRVLNWGRVKTIIISLKKESCFALSQKTRHIITNYSGNLRCKHILREELRYSPIFCIPLSIQDTAQGLLYMKQNKREEINHQEYENQRLLIGILGEQIALGISNIKLRNELQEQSFHDPLTGLYNRRYLDGALQGELRRAKQESLPLSIVLLDIDYFKRINDCFGHDAGDTVLVALAQILRDSIRSHDFACRYGGEEFIFISFTSKKIAMERSDNLHSKVAQLKFPQKDLGPIRISIGIASYPEDGNDPIDLIKASDIALYFAKNTGRNKTISYSPKLIEKNTGLEISENRPKKI